MMLNGPKNGLTYTQNDREKWRNTFTMFVFASLHVLVTEKVQQASTITLAPRCSRASESPGPAMVEFLSNPFIPCNLRPKYLKTGGVYPPILTCSMRPEGGPLGQAGKPRPKGCGPLPLPRGQATLHFWAVGGAMLSLTPKIIFEVGLAPIRGRWWVWVHPCAEKKKRRKRQNKVSNPLGPNFCKAHISKLVCASPFFCFH